MVGARSLRLSSTWPLATKLSGQPSLSKSASAQPQPTHGLLSAASPASAADSRKMAGATPPVCAGADPDRLW